MASQRPFVLPMPPGFTAVSVRKRQYNIGITRQ